MHGNNTSGHFENGSRQQGPRAKCDQVVFEAFAKAAEIVVNSRCCPDHRFRPETSLMNNSSRFNLLVPEIAGVRSIMQRWRRTLHVPLRLDVYYQHEEENRKQLLERWCLEYLPSSNTMSSCSQEYKTSDPIVQLRHVCKKIVIWLRTLYCWSRLLPAQAFGAERGVEQRNRLGFSIYVLTQDTDDDANLVNNQGFINAFQPAAVYTPYGQMMWKVIHAPKDTMDRLLPTGHRSKAPTWMPRVPTMSRPIPNQQYQQESTQTNSNIHTHTHGHTNKNKYTMMVPQSAPVKANHHFLYRERDEDEPTTSYPPRQNHPLRQQNTYHGKTGEHFQFHRSNSDFKPGQPRKINSIDDNVLLTRRNTIIGQSNLKESKRHLSGLSLALLNSDGECEPKTSSDHQKETETTIEHEMHTNQNSNHATESSIADKRRAALHHPPPHFENVRNSHQYGYAYNNHIPWQQVQQANNSNTSLGGTDVSPMGTPPSGALFAAAANAPPQISLPPTGLLIPPRNQMAPPFPSRPLGFIEASSKQQPPSFSASLSTAHQQMSSLRQHQSASQPSVPITSLDLLHSSPFHHPSGVGGTSLLSSLSFVGGGPSDLSFMTASEGRPASIGLPSSQECDHDMPFAVEEMDEHAPSAAVASFAQKCTPSQHRLKLFESETSIPKNDSMSKLADQLAEFHTFGASLSVTNGVAGVLGDNNEQGGKTTSAPISLKI